MKYAYRTPLGGELIYTSDLFEDTELLAYKKLYKFLWLLDGEAELEVDHIPVRLRGGELVALTPFQHVEGVRGEGTFISLLFDSHFYCIYGHDSEVSCNGLLFRGGLHVKNLKISEYDASLLRDSMLMAEKEFAMKDDLQEEMLRILLKKFIITCTRIARKQFLPEHVGYKEQDLIRQFYVLVDLNFKEKKKVKEYADLLHRSPKTISNLFAEGGQPGPLQVIHERIEAEAKRLLLHTSKSAKEIAGILGFDDSASFSRFFRSRTGKSILEYRKTEKREVLPTSSVK